MADCLSNDNSMDPDDQQGSKPFSRRRWLKRAIGVGVTGTLLSGAWAHWIEPFQLVMNKRDIFIPNLPAGLEGMRLAHFSDLHAGKVVPTEYLMGAMDRVNELEPDVVMVSGDLVNDEQAGIEPAMKVLARSTAPVYASLGNHDYIAGRGGGIGLHTPLANELTTALSFTDVKLLRNARTTIEHNGAKLNIVGLEDYWTQMYSPNLIFREIDKNETTIALSHNPDTVHHLIPHEVDLVLSGHTHGGQVRIPFFGAPILPVRDKRHIEGLYAYKKTQLHVSRGVGFSHQIRFNCRPEIVMLTLKRA